MRRALVVVIVTTVIGSRAPVASAQPTAPPTPAGPATADADQLAEQARAQATAGDFLGAAALFRSALALEPRPELVCNVGVAFHKAHDLPRAQLYLGQCLTRVGALDAGFAASVRAVFAAVEDNLRAGGFTAIDVTVTPSAASFTVSAFDPADVIVGDRLVWLPLGHHTLTARAEGYRDRTVELDVTAGPHEPVRLTLDREPPPNAPSAPTRRSRTPAILATAGTGALALGALGSYLLARSAADDAGERGISDDEYADRVSKARFRQHLAWGLGGAAAIGAVASGWLWYRATRAPAFSLEVEAGADHAGATLSGRF